MLKFVGAVLLCAIAVFFCRDYTRHQRQRLLQCEGFLLLLRRLRGQIECYSSPLEEALTDFENAALTECGFLPALKDGGFPAAIEKTRERLLLPPDSLRTLIAFGEGFGKSYREEQIALCTWTISELESAVAHVRRDSPRRAKMGRGLIISGGLALILVLL